MANQPFRKTLDSIGALLRALGAVGEDAEIDTIKLHVMSFLSRLDTEAHILGDGDFLELYQAALLRRGKTKQVSTDEVVRSHEIKEYLRTTRKAARAAKAGK